MWTLQTELAAQTVDNLNLLATEYRRKGEPSTVPRPQRHGVTTTSTGASSPEEVRAFFTGRVRGKARR